MPCPLPAPQATLCASVDAPTAWVRRDGSGGDCVQVDAGPGREGSGLWLPPAQTWHFHTPLRAEPGGCPGQNQALEDDMVQNSGSPQ